METDDYPTVRCPKCGKEETDMDGFGFIACIPGCGYCTHPSSDGDPPVCGICGASTAGADHGL
jgi:hypothetical protein